MDRVAAAAGVSKVTVYSRWPSKGELIGAALAHLRLGRVPEPAGEVRTDLIALLEAMREQYVEVGAMSILGTCLADEPGSGELLAIVRDATLLPRRALFAAVLRAGVERGELRAGTRRRGRDQPRRRDPLRRPPRGPGHDGAGVAGRRRRPGAQRAAVNSRCDASRAPAAIASNFAHITVGSTSGR